MLHIECCCWKVELELKYRNLTDLPRLINEHLSDRWAHLQSQLNHWEKYFSIQHLSNRSWRRFNLWYFPHQHLIESQTLLVMITRCVETLNRTQLDTTSLSLRGAHSSPGLNTVMHLTRGLTMTLLSVCGGEMKYFLSLWWNIFLVCECNDGIIWSLLTNHWLHSHC